MIIATQLTLSAQSLLERTEAGVSFFRTQITQDDRLPLDSKPFSFGFEIFGSYKFNYIGHLGISLGKIGDLEHPNLSSITNVVYVDVFSRVNLGENIYIQPGMGLIRGKTLNYQFDDVRSSVSSPTTSLEIGGGWKFINLYIQYKHNFNDSFDKIVGVADDILNNDHFVTFGVKLDIIDAYRGETGYDLGGGADY